MLQLHSIRALGLLSILALGTTLMAFADPAPNAASSPSTPDAARLAEHVHAAFSATRLRNGAPPHVSGLMTEWAIDAPGASSPPQVLSDGSFHLPLNRVGDTDIYYGTAVLADGTGMIWHYEVDGQRKATGDLEVHTPEPENAPQPDVPHGMLNQQAAWKSHVFEGTMRDWWVYVPAQYKPEQPACVMVFQDGGGYKSYVPVVFDNLIARGEMPVTVGVFINPGAFADGRSDRSFEYDTLSDQYSRFLLDEILPEVEKTVKLRHDPASRAIAGLSSGGICAWTVAWERPDEFSKVLSWIGSFTNIASGPSRREGGHNYPALIRKTPPKPIRILLQDGAHDLDNANGNWPLAAQQMAKALEFAGYDYNFVFGQGFHSERHGRSILPSSLRWLWRDYHAQ